MTPPGNVSPSPTLHGTKLPGEHFRLTGEEVAATRWQKLEQVTDRVKGLRQTFLDTMPEISVDRAVLITESYRETFGQPMILRRAKALEKILLNGQIYIAPGELLVGALAEKPRAVPLFPEYDCGFLLGELDTLSERAADRFEISEQSKAALREVLPVWQGNTLADQALALFPDEAAEAARDLVCVLTAVRSGVGHMIVDYGRLLCEGIDGILRRVESLEAKLSPGDREFGRKRAYYQAVAIVGRAVVGFAERFAELGEQLAAAEPDLQRRRELRQIAANCRKVPRKPAESFWEALQAVWLIQVAFQLESNGHSVSLGRLDQYLYPYFAAEQQAADSPQAEELLHCFWIKLAEVNKVRDKVSSAAFGGYPMFQHVSLGGVDGRGRSAVNALSHLCLEATAKVGLPQPSTSVRWFFGSPEDFLLHAVRVASLGLGMPAFFNDEVLVANMLQAGHRLEEARNYAIVGCTETVVPGISEPWLTGGFFNALKVLERTIFDGYDPVYRKQMPLQTGEVEQFATFDEFQQAYFRQLSHYFALQVECDNILDELHAALAPTPLESMLLGDCLERGKTSLEGGARFNSTTINTVGVANVADALAVIKRLIYEEKTLTWPELKQAMQTNFEKAEPLRQKLLRQVPKYGNDDPYVDDLGAAVSVHIAQQARRFTNARGGPYYSALYSVSSHALLADVVGATPDGRRHGDVLADGGVSCSQGRDEHGPTALLASVARLDPYQAIGSTLLNVKLHPSVFSDAGSYGKICDLIKTYFLLKGQHLQFNVIDRETLRDAQKHPDRYPALVVRVAGFSVLFGTIDPRLQEDIIQRTETRSGQ